MLFSEECKSRIVMGDWWARVSAVNQVNVLGVSRTKMEDFSPFLSVKTENWPQIIDRKAYSKQGLSLEMRVQISRESLLKKQLRYTRSPNEASPNPRSLYNSYTHQLEAITRLS